MKYTPKLPRGRKTTQFTFKMGKRTNGKKNNAQFKINILTHKLSTRGTEEVVYRIAFSLPFPALRVSL